MNLPNKLTIMRIILIPVFLLLLLPVKDVGLLVPLPAETGRLLAAFVFILAAATDLLDGAIARKRNCVTTLGKFLDPIADKLLVVSAVAALVQMGEASAWVVVIIAAREFIVQGIRILAAKNDVVIAASRAGKVKTFTQMSAILLILVRDFPFSLITDVPVGRILLWISVLLTIYSGYGYVRSNRQILSNTS